MSREHWFRRIVVLLALVTLAGLPATAQRGPARNLGRDVMPASPGADRAPIQDVVAGFYVSRLQAELGLEDAQFVSLLPAIRNSLDRRTELSQQRNRLRDAIVTGLDNGASDAELEQLIEEYDQTEEDLRNISEDLLEDMDPNLSTRERARLRIVQPDVENRIRTLIERSRNAGPGRGGR